MRLFLCEKPSQAKDIGAVLGVLSGRQDGFYRKGELAVTWAFGHILANAMPDAYGEVYHKWGNLDALPLLPDVWKMEIPDKSAKQFKVIKQLLVQADEVVIATDADREGEVIAREILDYCGYRNKVSRFWTSGLDPSSVKKALANIMPGQKTANLYRAGLARSRADWLVGMNLSRAYTVAYAAGFGKEHTLSVGRIQTPTLALVVRRDEVIDNFKPYAHYGLNISVQPQGKIEFSALWQIPEELKNTDGFCTDKAFVTQLMQRLSGARAVIETATIERKKTPPPLPYSLSALQKEASRRFGVSASKVLDTAQALYEKHKITSYPRTPCRYLPKSQQADVSQVFAALVQLDPSLRDVLAAADPQRASRVWNDTQVNKHSHHAIIPTMVGNVDLNALTRLERDVYHMIRDRYIAQFYPDYEYDAQVITLICAEQLFRAAGQTPRIAGWKALLGKDEGEEQGDEEESILPVVDAGEAVAVSDVEMLDKKTAPPSRFTEASLLEEMQTLSDFFKTVGDDAVKKILRATEGLGTEATRANIIDRLFEMNYLEKKKGKIFATDKGKSLIARIPAAVADPVTTAKWEMALAGIESGKIALQDFMRLQADWISRLVADAKVAAATRTPLQRNKNSGGKASHKPGEDCPDCHDGKLIERHIKDKPEKRYLGCSRYPECKHFEWRQ